MSADLSETIAPKSDQMNSDDLVSGPRTFTVAAVRVVGGEQPVEMALEEFPRGRPFKPGKSMRRVLVMLWGKNGERYVGRRFTLYRDPEVRFGGQPVGGIRISHMSHIDGRREIFLTVTKGKRAPYVVEPLPDAAPSSPAVSTETLAALVDLFERNGIPEDQRLTGVNAMTGGSATALEVITEDEAEHVIGHLQRRLDAATS